MLPFASKIGFTPRVSALYGAFFIVAGISQPFLPVWLKAKGLDPATIGLVLAAPMLLRVLTIPLATRTADRRDALRLAIIVAACFAAVGYGLMGLAEGALAILLAYSFASIGFTPLMPLCETYAYKGLTARGKAYGSVRLWGSATFILGNLVAGVAADIIAPRHIIWMIAIASCGTALVSFALMPVSVAVHATDPLLPVRRRLLRDPAFIAVVAAASLIQGSHAMFYGFTAAQWLAAGLDGAVIAALWALGVAAEIVLFALSARLPPFFTPTVLLIIGALGAALRWTGMAFDPPFLALPWLMLLHALSFGATHLGALGFVARHAPPGQAATAQGYLAIVMGLVMAAGTAISGVLFAAFGSFAFMAMALAAVVGGACAVVANRAGGDAPA
ncbi:MAG TPA: MFS transporter [Pseudolabrys sp.]|jgi:MFS transporter, PPP family, 3-phenylpropionic acid transporter|nr:MFS transporter [Pseudolabrys sp.]